MFNFTYNVDCLTRTSQDDIHLTDLKMPVMILFFSKLRLKIVEPAGGEEEVFDCVRAHGLLTVK